MTLRKANGSAVLGHLLEELGFLDDVNTEKD